MAHSFFDVSTPLVLGHRGSAGERPENTLPSFEHALEVGAHILESDVHVTADGVPVLIHDGSVDRTTEGEGPVGSFTLERLRELDAASRFSHDGGETFPFRDQGVRIPTLQEAFERFPDARFNLELKAHDERVVSESLQLVKRHGRENLTLLTAGEDEVMERLRGGVEATSIRPAIGASLADILDFVRSATDGTSPRSTASALQIPADFGGRPLATPALVEHAHAHGVQVHVWTINERDEIFDLLGRGVDGIVTDYPGRMARWLSDSSGARS